MPELPEVETVRKALASLVLGRKVTGVEISRTDLRTPLDATALQSLVGRTFQDFGRRGKHLIAHLSGGRSLLVHLGMSGKLLVCHPDDPSDKHDHVILSLDDGRQIRYRDPRRFGSLEVIPSSELQRHLSALGVEPLSPEFTPEVLAELVSRCRAPLKSFLLDQSRIAGIGNIYANEILFHAGLHPLRPAASLSPAEIERLHRAIAEVLSRAIARGGTTVRDYRDPRNLEGWFRLELAVYQRAGEPCPRCGATIQGIRHTGRSTFFCPQCQRD